MGYSKGLVAGLGASLRRGIEIVASVTHLEEEIQNSDLVFSGEGSYDAQTACGKAVSEVFF